MVLALLVASSDPVQKEVLIQLIINLLDATGGKGKGRDVPSEHYAKNTYCPWRRANLLNRRLRSSICNHQVALSFRVPQLTGHSGQLLW